ncbi:MAG: hypothetical protein DI623_15270 [Sphingomonas sanxanigenens]|uniref:HTH araC/xylS-type domain-containing protein n=1 Tax=Sphingomonas sanxanigenens TaxID=397260 RepID=A0A2W5BZK5_9SPHN|nr:MAG: hypothetical protein DI623_15270 [Sphingomonas sanxanigenens]
MSGPEHFRLSTDDLPILNRQDAIREYFGRMLQRMDYETNDERGMWLKAEAWLLPGISIGRSTYTPLEIERTSELLQDGRDDVMLCKLPSGGRIWLPDGTEVEVAPGDFVLAALNYRLHMQLQATELETTMMFQLPRSSLAGLADPFDERPLRSLSAAMQELALLEGYGRSVMQTPLTSEPLRQTVSRHLIDLSILALGASREASEQASRRGVRAGQLAFAKAEILRRLCEPDLSAASVAQRLRISVRYLHMLFEHEHMTFSEFVTRQRLARAHNLLRDPRRRKARIIDIALEAGFREVRTFNRTFREQFSITPSEAREA